MIERRLTAMTWLRSLSTTAGSFVELRNGSSIGGDKWRWSFRHVQDRQPGIFYAVVQAGVGRVCENKTADFTQERIQIGGQQPFNMRQRLQEEGAVCSAQAVHVDVRIEYSDGLTFPE